MPANVALAALLIVRLLIVIRPSASTPVAAIAPAVPAFRPKLKAAPSSVLEKVTDAPAAVPPPLVVSIKALPVKTVAPLKLTAPLAVVIVNAPMEIVPVPPELKIRLPDPFEVILAPITMLPPPAPFEAVIVRDLPTPKLVSAPA